MYYFVQSANIILRLCVFPIFQWMTGLNGHDPHLSVLMNLMLLFVFIFLFEVA